MSNLYAVHGRGAPRQRDGRWVTPTLLAFVVVQCADAYLTALGIARFGSAVEANPILAWYVAAFGDAVALVAAKAVAVGCAATLSVGGRHRTLAILTVFYVLAAIVPWMVALQR